MTRGLRGRRRRAAMLALCTGCASAAAAPARVEVPAPLPDPSAPAFTNVVYVVAGTAGRARHRDVLRRVHERVIAGGRDTSRYWEGVRDVVAARDAEVLYASVAERVCGDARPRADGGLGARNAYLVGFSRGAIIMTRVAREVRQRCNDRVAFVGLVDAVSTSMGEWPASVDSTIPAIHLVKTRARSPVVFETAPIAGIGTLVHPDPKINHDQLVCPVGHARDADGTGATWTESTLVASLEQAAIGAGAPITMGGALPPSCPPGLRKYFQ